LIRPYPKDFVEAFGLAESKANASKVFLETAMSRVKYAEVCMLVRKLASLYQEWDLKPGDRLAFSSKNDTHAAILFLSLLRNGITAVFIDPDAKKTRVEHLLKVSQPKALMLDSDLQDTWEITGIEHIIKIDNRKRSNLLERLLKKGQAAANREEYPAMLSRYEPAQLPDVIDPDLDAYVLFTSGTTSDPKGVRISHRALLAHLTTLSRQYGYSPDSRILNILILSHADGIIQGPVITFFNLAQLYRPLQFTIPQIPELLDSIYHYQISHFVAVPTMLSLIEKFGLDQHDAFQTDDFKFIISCGAQLEPNLWENFEQVFQTRIVNVYGLTETVIGGLFSGPDDHSHRIGTIGKPVDCYARIVDEKGNDVPPGERGELLLKGENIMGGYLNAPEKTAEVFWGDWLRTGDIATSDEQGLYRIVGRKKAVIISGGINIHPEEVTEVLNRHPKVMEAITFGLPDTIWGEQVVSAVGVKDDSVKAEHLINFCRDYLEEVKIPKKIFISKELPKGRSGKVQIEAVKKMFEGLDQSLVANTNKLDRLVIDIASQCFKVTQDSLSLRSTPDTVPAWDSLAHLELVMMLEESFDLRFSPVEIMQMDSLVAIKNMIESKLYGRKDQPHEISNDERS
jgi:long-chain acyl-CoA synthetase